MPKLPISGTELYYERRGAGEPLVLIQGLGANCLHWGEPLLAELERDLELVLFDNRGAGRSAPLARNERVTTDRLAADVAALLDGLGIERAHVLGISMGGMIAQELALAHPGRVGSLTLGCTSCGGTQSRPTDQSVIRALTAAVFSRDFDRMLRTGFGFVVTPAYAAQPVNYEAFVAAARHHPPDIPLLLAQQAAVVGHDSYARLRGLQAPTLVIHGTGDQLLAAVNGDLVASLVPDARLELLEDAGHLFFWEQPERSARLVREHVAAHAL